MKIKTILISALLAIGLIACRSTLEKGGAYAPGVFVVTTNESGTLVTNFVASAAPNKAFFVADATYDLAYSVIDTAFAFERKHRDVLWRMSPTIKKTLDDIRPKAWDLHVKWAKAREAYMLNPTPDGLSNIQRILSEVQNLSMAVRAVLPNNP